MTRPKLDTAAAVLEWAHAVWNEALEAVPRPVVLDEHRETAEYLAECVRLREAFDELVHPDQNLFEHCDGPNHELDIEHLRNAIKGDSK